MWASGCYARVQVGFIMRQNLFTSNCVALNSHGNPRDITVSNTRSNLLNYIPSYILRFRKVYDSYFLDNNLYYVLYIPILCFIYVQVRVSIAYPALVRE